MTVSHPPSGRLRLLSGNGNGYGNISSVVVDVADQQEVAPRSTEAEKSSRSDEVGVTHEVRVQSDGADAVTAKRR